jgi:peptidoglycan/xylan/chitin deacetylase (PgdA/CDA1 family)
MLPNQLRSASAFKNIERHWIEIKFEMDSFRGKSYPDFVTSESPKPLTNEVPIFTFHTIQPRPFEEQLNFLATNGYHTITCDEFYEFLTKRKRVPEKSVLLTIDDGMSSVWTYGFPLLRKYGFRAAVFLIPGYIKEGETHSLNLEDYWRGVCKLQDVLSRDESANPLLTWSQITEMHQSGTIDFQSHTLYHHKIYTAPRIIDFYNPSTKMNLYDLVIPKDFECKLMTLDNSDVLYGMPIYENDSLMAAKPRYLSNDDLTNGCADYVRKNGGRQFFKKKSWRTILFQFAKNYNHSPGASPQFQSHEEMQNEILQNLLQSKRLIEERLPGKTVQHLCYPYGRGSETSVKLSKAAGYVTNFWCVRKDRNSNKAGDNPFYYVRLKNDYIFRLPGKGRKSLLTIFKEKFARRIKGEPVY